jgi:hypothetical protein
MAVNDDVQEIDMALRARVTSLCAPIWWESGRQTVVNSGTMCVIKTAETVFGVTNNHVLQIYERHKAEKHDIFCQLGSGPFDPSANLINCSEYWDLATFRIPAQTLRTFGHKGVLATDWPPRAIEKDDVVVFGGYPEVRRSVSPGPNPTTMSIDLVSFRARPHHCSPEQVSFHVDPALVTWLPNVYEPLEPGASLSGMSGGPCFRLVPAEDRIELAGFIYEGDYSMGIIFVRQACLISAAGQIAPKPF